MDDEREPPRTIVRSRSRARAALAYAGRSAALLATFAGALVAGVSIHAGTPAACRVTAAIGNRVMAGLFEGKIVVTDLESLSIGRRGSLRARQVEVTDPEGKRVILAEDVEATIDLELLLRSIVSGHAPVVELSGARIRNADVVLDRSSSGPRIAAAFRPRGSAPPAAAPNGPGPGAPAKAPPRVAIASIAIDHAHVHGDLVPPALDGEVDATRARLLVENDTVRAFVDGGRVTLVSPHLPNQKAPIVGAATGALSVDLATTKLVANADLVASCAEVPITAHARIDGDRIDATIDVAEVTNAALATAFADLPVTRPLELHAHAQGRLPTLELEARGRVGTSNATLRGELDLREGHAFKLDIDASQIDTTAFGADLKTDLSAKVHGEGVLDASGGGPLGTFRVTTTDGEIASEHVPPTVIEGRFEARRVTATVRASEPGAMATGKVVLDVPAQAATFDLQARATSLRTFARAGHLASGQASARVAGRVDLAQRTIKATTSASGDGIALGAFSAKHLSASGMLEGPLASPVLDLGFAGVDVQLETSGGSSVVHPTANGRAKVAFAPSPRILDASLNIGTAGSSNSVSASAEGVHFANGTVQTQGLRVAGLGAPLELDVNVGSGEWHVRAKSAGVDLHRAAAITGVKELRFAPEGTRATVDIDVRQGASGANGHFDVALRSENGFGARPIIAEAHGTIERGKLVGNANVAAEGFGRIEISRAELDAPGRLDGRSLARTTGVIELRGAVDLAQGAALFAGENVERVAGIASFEARIERGDPSSLPTIRSTVRTEGLEVAVAGAPPSTTRLLTGVDLVTHFAWDGRTEDAELALVSWDRHGLLGSAGAKARVPLVAWATGVKKLDAAALAELAVEAAVDLPSREVADLPPFLGGPELRGYIDGHIRVAGTLGHPAVVVSARAKNIREPQRSRADADRPFGLSDSRSTDPKFDPFDGTLEARWDGERAAVTFALDEHPRIAKHRPKESARPAPPGALSAETDRPARREPGHVRGLVLLTDVRMEDLLRGRAPSELPWAASAEVEVKNLALAALPLPNGMTGALSGRARVKDINRSPSFEANAHVDGFGAGGAAVENLDLTIGGRDASLFAHASVTDTVSKGTFQLASQSLRINGLELSWNPQAPTRIDYAIQNGRLALLGPLLRRSVSEIDGRVDGAGSVAIDRNAQVFEGGLAIHGASLYVNAFGEEITNLAATARFDRTGVFRIEEATGKIGTGEFRASASGRMKGLDFMGAEATLIATKDGIPLSSEAATFAEATGEVKISANMSDDRNALLVAVEIPRANIRLPDRNTQMLQSLDPDPTVTVGVRRNDGTLDTSAVRRGRGGAGQATKKQANDALVARMTVSLGDEVHLEGRGLDVSLGGRTLVEIADELAVTGRIDLRGGTIEVHGRRFSVDRGTVTFSEGGDPDDPTIVAAAYWDAPDRTRVWVEFAGPLKTGKLTLRSEPAYSKNEILSVLLFGRPDPNMATGGGTADKTGDAAGATAVGTGFVAGDVNRMLSEIDEDLDVETDTLGGNRTRGKVGRSFFDRRLKVQVGYAPGGTYREPDSMYLFLNWQFIPKWSLVGTRGNKGTSILDVLFQHRY